MRILSIGTQCMLVAGAVASNDVRSLRQKAVVARPYAREAYTAPGTPLIYPFSYSFAIGTTDAASDILYDPSNQNRMCLLTTSDIFAGNALSCPFQPTMVPIVNARQAPRYPASANSFFGFEGVVEADDSTSANYYGGRVLTIIQDGQCHYVVSTTVDNVEEISCGVDTGVKCFRIHSSASVSPLNPTDSISTEDEIALKSLLRDTLGAGVAYGSFETTFYTYCRR